MRRGGFGPWPEDFGDYINAGTSGAIDRLLNYSTISNSELDGLISSLNLDFTLPQDLIRWFTLRMLYSKHPLEEKLTMFWHGVLVSGLDKGGKRMPPFLAKQNQTLRENCLGRFDDLIHAISIDPAMLVYLDGANSSGDLPNENYARELMELFTLGVVNPQGVANYTQNDVHQGALALTGWRIVNTQGVFFPARHYNGAITYLGHTGNLGLDDVVHIVCCPSLDAIPYCLAHVELLRLCDDSRATACCSRWWMLTTRAITAFGPWSRLCCARRHSSARKPTASGSRVPSSS